ncbi:PREDICTED: uncharacterized protein LOC108580248 [Habropoda laboriosa]|uniref:uncharacterized protein LOC108580248 n=1 Tax=Habropoda laboriosa TaxID=597456 RepID=UPI00083D7FB6|nr:PREDICTED: uncharacterized protein LOC108580248 [Habropoda laboriosa]
MFFHLVVILSLSWPHVIGTGNAELQDELAFDQVATASENVAQTAQKSERKQKEFRDQLITSIIDTTVHYENSNGFVPMVVSPSPNLSKQAASTVFPSDSSNITRTNSLNEEDNSSSTDTRHKETEHEEERGKFENDPVYSTEARIFLNFPSLGTNRRSFEFQTNPNEFELLKVRNNTPVVATYQDFYDDSSSTFNENEDGQQSSSKHKTKGKGQNMENYMGNYGLVVPGTNGQNSYSYYYSQDSAKDKEKKNHEQEKVNGNYHEQNPLNYDGHGQTRQNEPTASSFPRTNQEVNIHSYDTMASSSQVTQNNRFSRPVVVAESNYNFDQPRLAGSGNDNFQTSRILDSVSSEISNLYTMDNRNGRFRSDEDSRDVSDDGDYVEYTERPRRLQKGRRRPSDSSKRLPKEHRGSLDDSRENESQGKRYHSSRSKSHRQRVRGNSWVDEDRRQDDSYEDTRYDGRQGSKFKPSSSWNQVSPNLEISHSSGIEIGQLEKPKLIVPVKVNLVPVANFDHATAIGSSQGFDMSNAVLRNIVSATPVSTNIIGHDAKIRVSTPIPDIIVGQNSFHNPMQAFLPQINDQNKFAANFKPQYASSTVSPIYAVTPNLNPSLQSIPIQDVQETATSRATYVNGPHQVSTNHIPQLIVPQPTLQSIPTLVQTPITSPDYIQVNPHGMHGQNPISHGSLQFQPLPTMPTITPTPQTIPVTKISLMTSESQNKKTMLPGASTNFLASASFAVGQNDQRQTINGNSYYLQNSNSQQIVKPQLQGGLYQQILKNVNVAPKTKTYIQTTHLLPAVLQPMPTLTTISASTPQVIPEQQTIQGTNLVLQPRDQGQYLKIQDTGYDNSVATLRNIKMPSFSYETVDSIGSQTNSNINAVNASPGVSGIIENAHLPHVGTRNVEIVNPNIKPSPVDTIIDSYGTMHYPTAVLTTSIPMFTTTSFVTARPALLSTTTESTNMQNLVNSLTEIGSKNNQPGGDLKAYHSLERPVFNPINFVPNMDVLKNQNALNGKLHANEPLQQNLNLVPLIPGGNFFKPSFSAQSELLAKPKLTSDLENYAEQMFKESLKTIYNSQKWNNDRKPGNNRQNMSDTMDIAKLKNELQRLKASLSDYKRNNDQIEGHHSETKVKTAELPSKKPDELLAALEQMLKNHPSESLHNFQGNGKPQRHRRPHDLEKHKPGSNNDPRDTKYIREFLTPPQPNSHRSKGHYHDKPGKKRPGPSRYNNHNHYHGPRSHPRNNMSPKSGGIESSASNIDPIHADGFSHYDNKHDSRQFRKGSRFDHSSRDRNNFPKVSKQHKGVDSKENVYNHPKMHNLYGLLLKNKQLPNGGGAPNYFQDRDQLKQFFETEKQRLQQQFYDDTLRDYIYKMSDGMSHSNLGHTDTRRSLAEKRTV